MLLKIGGSLDGQGLDALLTAMAELLDRGDELILVHGGGPEISRQLRIAGLTLPFVNGVRMTTAEAIPVVVQALQTCNEQIQKHLVKKGYLVASVVDGSAVMAQDAGRERTGEVHSVNVHRLEGLLEQRFIPLVAPYAIDVNQYMYNLNADTVATHIAAALSVDKLVFCTDVSGVFADYRAKDQLYDVSPGELTLLLNAGAFEGGMMVKVGAMLQAAEATVPETWVVDGCDPASLLFAVAPFREGEVNVDRTQFGTCLVNRASTVGVEH